MLPIKYIPTNSVQCAITFLTKTNVQVCHKLAKFVHKYGKPDNLTLYGAVVQVGPKTTFQKNL